MSQITLRIAKGSALTQSEMDDNLKNLINSASVDITTGQLSLFTSESSGAEKAIDVRPQWFGLSGSSSTGVASITGSLLVTGDITAQQFNTEIISSSTIFESGSTIFGDDSNDTHQITGSLLVTGSETLEGNLTVIGQEVLSGSLTVSGSATIIEAIDSTGMSSKIRFHYNEFDDLPSATTYHGMFAHVHATGSAYYAHSGGWVRLAQSASFAIPIATLTAASASHETAINTLNAKTLVSSSDQIDGEISGSLGVNGTLIRSLTGTVISGSFTLTSASLAADITTNSSSLAADVATNLASIGTLTTDKADANKVSGSLGDNATLIRSLTGTIISGSFTSTSASLATDIATNLASVSTLTTDKANKNEITGSFALTSASLATDITTNLTSIGTLTSDKANKSEISGSLGDNATLIRSLTATSISGSLGVNASLIRSLTGVIITGSFAAASGSFSTRIGTLEAAGGATPGLVSSSAVGDAQGQIKINDVNVNVKDLQTTSNVTFADITGSGLLSVTGTGTSQFTSHLKAHCLGIGTDPSGTTGEIRAAGDITAYYSSDERLKENITNIKEPLQKLSYINGVEFDWIPKEGIHSNEGHDVGVIAQEIEKVLPELVTDRENGFKAVRYEKIVALLIEAVKEQQLQIDELKSKL